MGDPLIQPWRTRFLRYNSLKAPGRWSFRLKVPKGFGFVVLYLKILIQHAPKAPNPPSFRDLLSHCRDSPYPDPADFDSDDDEPRGVTVKEAIKRAKVNRKNCKQTDRMLKTISKWRHERKEARARPRPVPAPHPSRGRDLQEDRGDGEEALYQSQAPRGSPLRLDR